MRLLIVLAGWGMLALPCAAQQASSPLDDIRADVDAKNYQGALAKIDKQLFPSSTDSNSADRYALLMLKGECRLQLMDRIGASSAWKSAGKSATNVNDLAAARANMLIADRSTSGRYTPRYGTGMEPIDIQPMDARKRAMIAYEAELASQYKTQIESALRAQRLQPIEQVFTHAADMYALELFATGQADDSAKTVQALGAHAFDLMQGEVTKFSRRVDELTQLANSASSTGRGWNVGRLGLTSQQRDELKTMLPYLNQIRDRASEYRGIAARLGGDEAKWNALVAQTVDTISDAESLYKYQ